MTEHPNVELTRRGYAAFAAGDLATMTELIADDVTWHVTGAGPRTGTGAGAAGGETEGSRGERACRIPRTAREVPGAQSPRGPQAGASDRRSARKITVGDRESGRLRRRTARSVRDRRSVDYPSKA